LIKELNQMGRISAQVKVTNLRDPHKTITFSGLVDTGAAQLVLPLAWLETLGELDLIREVDCELGNQTIVKAEVRGPIKIKLEGFPPIYSEAMFIEMSPSEGEYEPLIGYTVLEIGGIAVDMLGHRLLNAKRIDLK
jgi:predicted aspartyl protease